MTFHIMLRGNYVIQKNRKSSCSFKKTCMHASHWHLLEFKMASEDHLQYMCGEV